MVIPRHHITPFYMYLCRRYYIGSCWDLLYDVLKLAWNSFSRSGKDISLDEFVFYDKANITGKIWLQSSISSGRYTSTPYFVST